MTSHAVTLHLPEPLKRWTFEPARINGRPIPVYFTIGLRFCPH